MTKIVESKSNNDIAPNEAIYELSKGWLLAIGSAPEGNDRLEKALSVRVGFGAATTVGLAFASLTAVNSVKTSILEASYGWAGFELLVAVVFASATRKAYRTRQADILLRDITRKHGQDVGLDLVARTLAHHSESLKPDNV